MQTINPLLERRSYERLNVCVFSDSEWNRILSQAPFDGVPIPTRNGFELALFDMPNGSKQVVLKDDEDGTWEAYCDHVHAVACAPNKIGPKTILS